MFWGWCNELNCVSIHFCPRNVTLCFQAAPNRRRPCRQQLFRKQANYQLFGVLSCVPGDAKYTLIRSRQTSKISFQDYPLSCYLDRLWGFGWKRALKVKQFVDQFTPCFLATMSDLLAEKNLLPKRGASAPVWKYFGFEPNPEKPTEALDKDKVTCVLCNRKLAHKSGTSAMHKHLKSMHTREYNSLELVLAKPIQPSGNSEVSEEKRELRQQSILVRLL